MNTKFKPLLVSIDDEEGMRDIVTTVARRVGFEAVGIAGPREINRVLQACPAVIVLDLSMPDMDGIEVVVQIGKMKTSTRILLLSGFDPSMVAVAEKIANGMKVRLIGSMAKPVVLDELHAQLTRTLAELRVEAGASA